MEQSSILIIVEGHVQGVGFRFFTYKKALQLALTGYVRNLPNGQVEIVAIGTPSQLDELMEWLKQGGPRSAHIKHLQVGDYNPIETFKTFSIRT